MARYLEFEDIRFYSLSVYHYKLHDKKKSIITGWLWNKNDKGQDSDYTDAYQNQQTKIYDNRAHFHKYMRPCGCVLFATYVLT